VLARCPDPGVLPALFAPVQRSLGAAPTAQDGDELSGRELAVLRLLPTRLSQREIGDELYVSLNTVKTHTRNVFRKLGVTSREDAVQRARAHGLIR
jgi:LuxR family transcriptional regulator, maltose regulon positive regulatory protein